MDREKVEMNETKRRQPKVKEKTPDFCLPNCFIYFKFPHPNYLFQVFEDDDNYFMVDFSSCY